MRFINGYREPKSTKKNRPIKNRPVPQLDTGLFFISVNFKKFIPFIKKLHLSKKDAVILIELSVKKAG